MGLETGTYVNDLNVNNPVGATDAKSEGDNHLRLIKSVLKATFVNAVAPVTLPSTASVMARTDAAQTFTGVQTFSSTIVGSVNGNAGTASAVAVGGITGLGTGVATALAVNVGSAGAPVTNGGALGTPASGTLTNCTFPTLNQNTTGSSASCTGNAATATTAASCSGNAATASAVAVGGITGLGTGVATALAANVGSAGAPVTNGGALGTPASGTLTNCTFPTLNQNTTGTASNITAYTINQSVGTGNSPSFVDVTITSDESLKENWRDFSSDVIQRLARVKRGIYDRLDVPMVQVGTSANSLQRELPEMVSTKDGKLQISQSGTLALLVELAAEVVRLRALVEAK